MNSTHDFDNITDNISQCQFKRKKLNEQYKPFTLSKMENIRQLKKKLKKKTIEEMKVVAHVLPFKTNNYVINNLIDWEKVPNDPIFKLVFPQKEMLLPQHYKQMKKALATKDREEIRKVANEIRLELNPNPAGQKTYNVPIINGKPLKGIQHKYRETVLLFPTSGQTCHAYCTFCFRWNQFVSLDKKYKFGASNSKELIDYIHENPEITDILVTGGDPMVMRASVMERYFKSIMDADLPNLQTIRIGSKSLSYWPRRFIDDRDTDHILELFQEIQETGLNVAFMAHFNHYKELMSTYLELAVDNLHEVGVQIRSQSPLLNHINASGDIWAEMWRRQIDLKIIPYYMFVARDTGAQHYFGVPLVKAWRIFKKAYNHVSGIARTVRGPSMSCSPGKIVVEGVTNINRKKVIVLKFIQGRNPAWVKKPFFAKYDSKAVWIDELEPAFSKSFFYERDLKKFMGPYNEIKNKIVD